MGFTELVLASIDKRLKQLEAEKKELLELKSELMTSRKKGDSVVSD